MCVYVCVCVCARVCVCACVCVCAFVVITVGEAVILAGRGVKVLFESITNKCTVVNHPCFMHYLVFILSDNRPSRRV